MRKKWILLLLVFLVLSVIMSITVFCHNKLVDVSDLIKKEKPEDLVLTIYYMEPNVLTDIPISVDMIKSWGDKVEITGKELEEHIAAFKQINKKTLKLVRIIPANVNVRMYYVLESKKNGKLFDVAVWGNIANETLMFNGVEIKNNRIFYDVVLPFLPEDIAGKYGEPLWE